MKTARVSKLLVLAAIGVAAACGCGRSAAAPSTLEPSAVPEEWPWRGIAIGFPEGTPETLERYARQLRINMVSLHLASRRFAKIKGVDGRTAFEASVRWAESMLDKCAALELTAVVDISHFPLDPQAPDQTTPAFWGDPAALSEVVAVADALSRRLNRRGRELSAYAILTEPVLRGHAASLAPPAWPGVLRRIVTAIRKHDAHRWIVVQPGPWGLPDAYAAFQPPSARRLIWGAHMYAPHAFTHQGIRDWPLGIRYPGRASGRTWNKIVLNEHLRPLAEFQRRNPGPVWIGEFAAVRWAEGAESYLRDLASVFTAHGWGWTYFGPAGWHGWNPDYNEAYGDDRTAADQLAYEGSRRWATLREIFGRVR